MKKDLDSGAYWDAFGRGLLKPEDRPEPKEAADHIIKLMVQIKKAEDETAKARHEAKCAKQQFGVFAMEVGNIARKYETV